MHMKLSATILGMIAATLAYAQPTVRDDASIDSKITKKPFVYPSDSDKNVFDKLPSANSSLQQKISNCNNNQMPLSIYFSDYTINQNGQIVQDGGWLQGERDAYFGFICKMMPILVELYGPPFEHYNLTFVKDLRFSTSAMFVPTDQTIRTSGRYWLPQLITHELLHAFRGSWHLTRANNSSQYSPQLSGFEEAFAHGVSYDAMNAYLDFYGTDQYVTRNTVWISETEWDYDYKNDNSMITEDFWSDEGGTRKYFERYEQSAAAIQKLNVKVPQLYSRFNQLYYQTIRNNTNYQPTRQSIINIIDQLTEDADILQYLHNQKILRCTTSYGKKIYTTTSPTGYEFAYHRIHFVETFPTKNEWYMYVPSLGNYLYHRLNYTQGYLNVHRTWNNTFEQRNRNVTIKDLRGWGDYQACGINCSKGFGAEDVLFYFGNTAPSTGFNNPLLMPHPSTHGLFRIEIGYNNPNFSARPQYAIYYDALQTKVTENKHEILGLPSNIWSSNRIFGGVANLDQGLGFVTIHHSRYPKNTITVPIVNGVFYSNGLSDWYQVLRGTTVTKPGILHFEIQTIHAKTLAREKRYIVYGNHSGKHKFLFELPTLNKLNAKATGPE